jgi:DnaJ-class molecular chaperone
VVVEATARAYAILGLRQDASLGDVRRRYRFLAQRWHPERFCRDANAQNEATATMARINAAYQVLAGHLPPSRPHAERTDRAKADSCPADGVVGCPRRPSTR